MSDDAVTTATDEEPRVVAAKSHPFASKVKDLEEEMALLKGLLTDVMETLEVQNMRLEVAITTNASLRQMITSRDQRAIDGHFARLDNLVAQALQRRS